MRKPSVLSVFFVLILSFGMLVAVAQMRNVAERTTKPFPGDVARMSDPFPNNDDESDDDESDDCPAYPAPVAQTGQTYCYHFEFGDEWPFEPTGTLIDCTGTGQDGEYQKGVSVSPRFTDNGDGTVRDNLTGLVWLRNANCFGMRDWASALSDANTLADGSCELTDGSVEGDWRLPNVRELFSLIDLGQMGPALPPDHPFHEVQSDSVDHNYVSSTPWSVAFAGEVFAVSAFTGDILRVQGPLETHWVWPVRDAQ